MMSCVKWRVRSRRGCPVVAVDSVWHGNGRQDRRWVTDRVFAGLAQL